jgi:two-component system chemotaxis response regulator CheY
MNANPSALTALVVDDETYFRRFVSELLSREGIDEVVEARDGHEAVALFNVRHPGLVVLDINMPRMDGLETLKALRRLSADVPIIMLTSIADEMVVEECVEEGASFFIRKDVPAHELAGELRKLLAEFLDREQLPS